MSIASAELELAILAIKRLQTYALESKAAGIDYVLVQPTTFISRLCFSPKHSTLK
jgi:hypothetical protein